MQRPPSIVQFERLYLGSFAGGLIVTALGWKARAAMQAGNPLLAGADWVLPVTTVIGIVVSLTLWYFTARSPSVIAKWVVVVFAAFSVVGIGLNAVALVGGRAPDVASSVLSIVVSAIYIIAAAVLFRPDAKTWFGEEGFADHERE